MPYVVRETAEGCVRLRLSNTVANVITLGVVQELAAEMTTAARESRAILLCGGERFFSNGLDLDWALALPRDSLRAFFLSLGDLVVQMLETPLPIVGVIRGHAIGAAKTLFSACDHRLAATGRVLVGVPEIQLGVPNPYFADQLLRLVVGDTAASDLIYSGRLVPAEETLPIGLVHRVADRGEIEALAWRQTTMMGGLPRRAFAYSKRMRTEALCERIRRNLPTSLEGFLDVWFSTDTQALLREAAAKFSRQAGS
jgi:enoyl-CoA hydratase/carnithine racemase